MPKTRRQKRIDFVKEEKRTKQQLVEKQRDRVKRCKSMKKHNKKPIQEQDVLYGATRRKAKGTAKVINERKQRLCKETEKPEDIKSWLQEKAMTFEKSLKDRDSFKTTFPLKFYKDHIHEYAQWSKVCILSDSSKLPSISDFDETQEKEDEIKEEEGSSNKKEETSEKKENFTLMYQLHLCGKNWVHVAESKGERGKGLFASKRFEKGDAISIYIGYRQENKPSQYRCQNVDVSTLENNLLLGAHFINSSNFGIKKGEKPLETANAVYRTDYLVEARVRIEKDEEILTEYNWPEAKTL